jgi:hypothetical protein
MKRILLILLLCQSTVVTYGKSPVNKPSNKASASISGLSKKTAPLCFIENKGQVTDQNHNPRPDIQFRIAAAPGLNIFIGKGAIHYQFSKSQNPNLKIQVPGSGGNKIDDAVLQMDPAGKSSKADMYRMDVELAGANKNAQVITEEKQDYYENYFTSITNGQCIKAEAYGSITYKDIYPHIDWVLYINNGQLEHEFVVNEGGRVSDIQLKYGGATGLKLNADGTLTAGTPQGTITEQAPASYEANGKVVRSSFKLSGNMPGNRYCDNQPR